MEGEARQLVDEQLICGMHVHVGVPDREMGVAVLNRIRGWLPTLLAMSVNSPLWDGRDTGFASWRTIVFRRWPLSGPPPYFDGLADYEARADALAVPGMPVMACLLVHEAHAQTGSSHAAPTEPGSCGGSRPWVNRPPGGLSGGGTCGRSRRLLHRGRC
ncbi:Carboxylate-amine ligase YbdK [Streptomyces lavendulae subsp. lavendulae]|uniref:Carboxylate-amine ligase YbdK n=1 Tax=Streptomyces lavendulae subsp. lavendulae TaxID=58340 RepID=A0A2K8P9Q7_STRLA|nr:Carboxylate-amine ligase YbdK [Streptomyces lavendulae subsp. lavendulae]QUQ53041.1 Glutamate--cysteine ligase [Streptomyces lavendulae subsp. lavendulae]